MDIRRVVDGASSQGYNCNNQGISSGWADIYDYTLDGQWVDITGVNEGIYTLKVTVNYERKINETDYGDNTFTVPNIFIPASGGSPATPDTSTCSALGAVCGANDDCCSNICHHASDEEKLGRMLEHAASTCVCTGVGERCTADHHCCSNKCKREVCRGS
jgi:hypothetical protein